MQFNIDAMVKSILYSIHYLGITLLIPLVALAIGIVFGLVIALLRYYQAKVIAPVLQAIVTLFKGIPIVLILLAMYLFCSTAFDPIAQSLHWSIRFKNVNTIWIAIVGLGIMAIVNASEIFRGAFASIRKGQLDAAQSIGMTRGQTIRRVLLPEAIPVALPVLGNLLINLIKASALCSMVGVVDIFSAATISGQQSYSFLEAYVGVALIYWAVVVCIEKGTGLVEHRLTSRLGRAAQ